MKTHAQKMNKARWERYVAKDPELAKKKAKAASKKRASDPEKKAADAKRIAQWKRDNRDKVNATKKARQMKIRNAMPPDADKDKILEFYTRSTFLNDLYGCTLTVDHVIPIDKGGLHHQDNLQLLTGSMNSSKNNLLDWVHPFNVDEMELTDPTTIEWLLSFD